MITAMEMMQSNNKASFITQLNKINTSSFVLGSGSSPPEPGDIALDKTYNNFAGTWRNNVAKLVILITDAPPSGTNDTNDAADTTAVKALATKYYNKNIRLSMLTTNAMLTDAEGKPYIDMVTTTGGTTSTPITDAGKILDAINAIP